MTEMTYRQALNDTLRAELTRDENVYLIGEEIGVFEGSYKITAGLLAEFGPSRVRDTPIAQFVLYRLRRDLGPQGRLLSAILDAVVHDDASRRVERDSAMERSRSHTKTRVERTS